MRFLTIIIRPLAAWLLLLCYSAANSQSAEDVLQGTWEGKLYLGTPPDNAKSYGGIGSPPLYDSCYVVLTITSVRDTMFSGIQYVYFISDQAGSFNKSIVTGSFNESGISITPQRPIEEQLNRYAGWHWCGGTSTAVLAKTDTAYLMHMTPPNNGCVNGSATLYKRIPLQAPVAAPIPDNSPDLAADTRESKKAAQRLRTEYNRRQAVVVKTVEIEADSITIDFYDNATIDGDSISIFFNGQAHTLQRRLTAKPFTIHLRLDPSREFNEIGMFAENLGTIPPNTALMVIRDTHKKHEILMSSDKNSNAVVRLKPVMAPPR